KDIVALTRSGPDRTPELSVYRRASEGALSWRRDTPALGLLGVIQVDRDRHLDIIAGGRESIECYHGGNGYRLWKALVPGRWATFSDHATSSKARIYAIDKANMLNEIHALSGRIKILVELPGSPMLAPVVSKRSSKVLYFGLQQPFGEQSLFLILSQDGKRELFRWKSPSRILAIREVSVRGGIDSAVAVLTERGPVMVFSVPNKKNLLSLGSEDSQFSALEVGAISGTGLDDIVVSERGQIKVFSGTSGGVLWTKDGRFGLPFESKTRSEPGRLWIDGRLFDGVEGKDWTGAAAGPWIHGRRYPGPVVDVDGDGSAEVLAVGTDSRSLVMLRTNESPLLFKVDTANATDLSTVGAARCSAVLEGRGAVVFLGDDGRILWRKQLDTRLHSVSLTADVDGDQLPEVVVAGERRLFCLSGKLGSTLWTVRKTAGTVMGVDNDFDDDKLPDIITSNPAMIVSSKNGAIIRKLSRFDEPRGILKPGGHPKSALVTAGGGGVVSLEKSAENSGKLDRLVCYETNGSRRWSKERLVDEVALFPRSSRGEVSRCIVRNKRFLMVLGLRDGEKIWSKKFSADIVGMCLTRSAVKGEVRIVAVDSHGRVSCRDGNGQRKWATKLPSGAGLFSGPVIFKGVKREAVAIAGASNDLFFLDTETGVVVWTRHLVETANKGHRLLSTKWGSAKRATLLIVKSDGTLTALQPRLKSRAPVYGKAQKLHQLVIAQKGANDFELKKIGTQLRQLSLSNSNWIAARLEHARLLLKLEQEGDSLKPDPTKVARRKELAESARKIGLSAIQQIRNESSARGDRGISIDAIFIFSDALITLNDFSGARTQITKLRTINLVASADLAIRLGNRALKLKKFKEGRQFFNVAVASQPYAAKARRGRALSKIREKPIDDHLERIRADLKMAMVVLDRDVELRAVAILIAVLRKDYEEARELCDIPGDLLEESDEKLRLAFIAIRNGVETIEKDKGAARSSFYSALLPYGLKHGWGDLITTIRSRLTD
ncbi:MAG: PQQ-binding-like beta-propeller repeat protein, partial [Planctomycetota bacterium]|nr:PQQ-binding-like beta-propeller repeat protein [Planctomycetota bacterium]